MSLTVGSLFSGVGGMDLGLERAGMTIKWMVEIDDYCRKVLTKHWPNVPKYKDIRDVKDLEPVDLICGGFPCQPFSVAGKRKGTADDRHLWPEMLRVISELKPTWVIGENVSGIINLFLDQAISDLEAEGYSCESYVLPACAFDAPHRRDRLFIIARRGQTVMDDTKGGGRGFWNSDDIGKNQRNVNTSGNTGEGVAGEILGNPSIEHIHERNYKSKESRTQIPQSGNAGGERPVSNSKSNQGRGIFKRRVPPNASPSSNRRGKTTRWLPEPDVGRVVAGISTALDGTLRRYGYEKNSERQKQYVGDSEAFAEIDFFRGEILRTMWHEQKEIEPPPYSPTRRGSDDSVYEVSCLRTHERWNLGQRIEKEKELCDLRDRIYSQPFKESQQLQQELLERIRAQERDEKMASQRVNRLKGLGNAVVPQVAEFIGRIIMDV